MKYIDNDPVWKNFFECAQCLLAWHFVRNHERAKLRLEQGREKREEIFA